MAENESTNNTAPIAPKTSNRSAIIIGLLIVIILIQGVKWYLDSKEIAQKDEKIASTEQELATTMQQLTDIKAELEEKIAEVQKLGGNVADLEKAKAEIETELKRTKRANGKVIKDLKDKVEGYEQLLKNKDEEIEKLKSVNKELASENRNLKTKQNQLSDTLTAMADTKKELAAKVAKASQLRAENVKILAVNDRGKERESPFKNRQVGKLKIEFNIAENAVAPIEGKKILVRIIDENGQVIFDVTRGSGTFMYNGKEEFYTASQEVLFDNTKQKLTYLYEKGSEYASGTYTLEVYTDDYKMGSGQFVVK